MYQVPIVQFFRTHEKLAQLFLLATVSAGLYLIADHHDIFRRITANSDQDIVLTYNALLFNQDLPQQYFDHTGYVYFLILSTWLTLLQMLGLVPISAFGELTYSQASYGNLEQLIYAGRFLSIILCALLTMVFYFGMRMFIKDTVIAIILTFVLVISPGISVQILVMRNELPAMLFVLIAFFLGATAPEKSPRISHTMLFGAAFFATLGMMTKVQIAPLVAALPPLFLLFALSDERPKKEQVSWSHQENYGLLAVSLFAVSVPAQIMIWTQVFLSNVTQTSIGGWYQVILSLIVIGCTIFYAMFQRFKIDQILLSLALVGSGISFATYVNFFHHSVHNTYIVVNFFEHMSNFSGIRIDTNSGEAQIEWLVNKFSNGILQSIGRNFDISQILERPLVIFYWFVLIGGSYALVRRDKKTGIISFGILGLSIGMEAFTSMRYWADHYRIFTEVWILIASGQIIASTRHSMSPPAYFKCLSVRKTINGAALITLVITVGYSANFAFKTRIEQLEKNGCNQVTGFRQPYEYLFCKLNK